MGAVVGGLVDDSRGSAIAPRRDVGLCASDMKHRRRRSVGMLCVFTGRRPEMD
jgi:hypothetical protein